MKYLKFKEKKEMSFKENNLQKLLIKIAYLIFPKANPDFEERIDNVYYWLLEFEDEERLPNREIGLDENEKTILKMPYKKNYGYWTDNNMKYQDFISTFDTEKIDEKCFNEKWNEIA